MPTNALQKVPAWIRLRISRRNLPVLAALLLVGFFLRFSFKAPPRTLLPISQIGTGRSRHSHPGHPIDDLIRDGEQMFQGRLAEQSHDLPSAAAAYRKRRERHPPPGFDKWYEFAQKHDAIIVEEFFDQIYHDIAPFWALSPRWIAKQSQNFDHVISIRRGRAKFRTDGSERVSWVPLWVKAVSDIVKNLPDMDIPINVLDGPRILVPWQKMATLLEAERSSRRLQPADTVSSRFSVISSTPPERFEPQFTMNGPFWEIFRHTCPPDTGTSNITAITDFSDLPLISQDSPAHSYQGYVKNWTVARSACHSRRLQSLHGAFIEPSSVSATQELAPMFAGSKLLQSNEILIPPAMYWSKDSSYSPDGGTWSDWLDVFGLGAEPPWEEKRNRFLWRGVASGGRSRKESWTHFQRHRFVQMMNGSAVRGAGFAASHRLETSNVPFPDDNPYNLTALRGQTDEGKGPLSVLGEWLSYYTDVAFTNLVCFPASAATDRWKKTCPYSSPFFKVKGQNSRRKTFGSKYLPDLDGNSYSPRFLSLLRSQSLPIKATVYSEWHDHRIIPWVHFVPLDNTLVDIYGVMEYFLGFNPGDNTGRDDIAQKIALQGQAWAERTMRGVDMQIYLWRVLLEFARVCDVERDRLGWADDLLKEYKQKK